MKALEEAQKAGRQWLQNQRDRRIACAAWSQADTFADVGELTARWLERSVPGHPAYYGSRPDEETDELVPALAALNRAGFVTMMSQPGVDEVIHGARAKQRATVHGYVDDPDLLEALMLAAAHADLWFVAYPPNSYAPVEWSQVFVGGKNEPDDDGWFEISTVQDETCTSAGGRVSARETRFSFSRWCSRAVANELTKACQLTVVDPIWGRDDRLWPSLAAAISDRSSADEKP